MKLYELVIVLHPSLSTEDSNDLTAKIEWLFPKGIKHKDDIGYQTVYNVHGVAKGSKAYFISYLLEVDPSVLPEAKQKLRLMKGLIRTLFLARNAKNPFHDFAKLSEQFAEKVATVSAKDKKWSRSRKGPDAKQAAEVKEVEIVVEDNETAADPVEE